MSGLLLGIKHSPGPWRRVGYLDNPARESFKVHDAEGYEVASISGWHGEPDTSDADADLIAAAPEMLAALVAAEEDLDEVPGKEDPPSLAAVRAVIAKIRRKT